MHLRLDAPITRRLAGVLIAGLVALAPAHAAEGPPYPRLANVYLLGSLHPEEIPELARWDVLILNTVWPDSLLQQLRSHNPDIRIFLYVCHYCIQSPPAPVNVWEAQIHDYIVANDLWWYNRDVVPASDWVGSRMINITKVGPRIAGHLWTDYLSSRVESMLMSKSNANGVYYDNFYRWVSWQQVRIHVDSDCNPTHNPAGCNGVEDSPELLDSLWFDALQDLAIRTRQGFDAIGPIRRPDVPLAILGGRPGAHFDWLNGGFYENFPNAGGRVDAGPLYRYRWSQEMFEYPDGYLVAPVRQDPFTAQVVNTNWYGTATDPARSPDFERLKRFTLGSTLLADGYYSLDVFAHQNRWWEPEYDNGGRAQGYLGWPLGPYRRILEPTGPERIVNGSFDTNTSNWFWQYGGGITAALTRDTQTFHSAPASCRMDITAGPEDGWFKLYQVVGTLEHLNGYTLSFWAKASAPQEILLQFYSETCPDSRCMPDRKVHLTTEWRQIDVPFVSAGTGLMGMNIYTTKHGSVWFDDVSFRDGDTNLYRRDFDRGTVIVNYTMSPQVVDLGGTYYRLSAPGFPHYDGAAVTSVTVANSDAVILLTEPTETTDAAPRPSPANRLDVAEPNPFNPTTRIQFALAAAGQARLAIYDVAGRLVRVLADGRHEAGEHDVMWDGRDGSGRAQPSGVYVYRLTAPGFARSERMTLLR